MLSVTYCSLLYFMTSFIARNTPVGCVDYIRRLDHWRWFYVVIGILSRTLYVLLLRHLYSFDSTENRLLHLPPILCFIVASFFLDILLLINFSDMNFIFFLPILSILNFISLVLRHICFPRMDSVYHCLRKYIYLSYSKILWSISRLFARVGLHLPLTLASHMTTSKSESIISNDILPKEHRHKILKTLGSYIIYCPTHIKNKITAGVYKKVDKRIRPVPGVFPEDLRVIRQFPEDPLCSLPELPIHPPEFTPGERITYERLKEMQLNEDKFLWPEEEKLFAYILKVNEKTLAFEEVHRGTFREDYFSPYIIPVIPHIPWEHKNIPIPPALKEEVIKLLKEKIDAGVYEPSQASYRSRWFCVVKKNGKLRIVHDLQVLNGITIRDAGLPPVLDDFVEPYAGRQCYTVFDLFWGFDARKVAPESRDLTSFWTPLGLLRITSMPMGFTNSPAEFQKCMVFILQDEIPKIANIFIDDLPIKGPMSRYEDKNGNPETLPENPGIRRFIWEHANDVHRIMHRVGHAGGTFSPKKTQIARPEVIIVGQKCTPQGRLPEDSKVQKILNWPLLTSATEVRQFLGLCGTVRIWIKNYSAIVRPLTELIRHTTEFVWDERRQQSFDILKKLVSTAPALCSIDYASNNPVILSVDSSKIAVGFILSQIGDDGKRRPARYGSIPMNEREANYSQPKLELYGLFRALRHYRLFIVGVKNLHVEVDAKYIKGMLNEPDLQPNATINRWIQGILLFDFKLIHVPATQFKGPDALSRRAPQPEDYLEFNDEFLDEIALFVQASRQHNEGKSSKQVYATNQVSQDEYLLKILQFLMDLKVPEFADEHAKQRFLKRSLQFYVKEQILYKRNKDRPLKVIFDPEERYRIMVQAHEELGHRGEFATHEILRQRFYWPFMHMHVKHHVQSCSDSKNGQKHEAQLDHRYGTLLTGLFAASVHHLTSTSRLEVEYQEEDARCQ